MQVSSLSAKNKKDQLDMHSDGIWENEMDLADGIFMGGDDPWETFRAINDSVERMMCGNETALGKGVGSIHIS
ncbi:hypothetical protein TNCT_86381 [Trichonephila clavata]|uniref:Uncharacterized protein n=1 Tax=Trichonephila clavata TaxID=2740835 RepID=A0A8X6M3C6_TRICU|nr:hypothetical protein TNCT_86381 [Trichonephila clavata]